jgi:hypothetical protein
MSRGFTIVEALCAFAVLSLVLVALYEVGGTTSRMLVASTSRERETLLAESKLDAIASTYRALPPSSDGRFEGSDVRWRVETRDIARGPSTRVYLQAVRLTVFRPDDQPLTVETRHLAVAAP